MTNLNRHISNNIEFYINGVFNQSFPDKYPDRPMYLEVAFKDPGKKVENLYIYKEVLKTHDTIQTTEMVAKVDGYKRGFQGQLREDEISGKGNSYTAEFWQYSPRLGKRWNIDPVFKEHESPYATFANNPIWFSDPDGRDTINIFNKGGKIDRLKGGDNDVFQIVDKNKKVLESLSFDKGTIQYSWNYKNESKETDLPINVLQIKGNSNAESVFKMAARETDVEWSLTTTKRGNSSSGFITTSHEKSSEKGSLKLFKSKLIKENYVIYVMEHSHPRNTAQPSGRTNKYDKSGKILARKGEWGDMGFARTVGGKYEEKYKNNIAIPPIQFYIFLPRNSIEVQFNENGKVE